MRIFFLFVPPKKIGGHFIVTCKVVPVFFKFKLVTGFMLYAGLSYIW